MTQEELGMAVGTDRFQIGRFERGRRVPDAVTLLRLLEALGSDLGQFQTALTGRRQRPSRDLESLVEELRKLGSRRRGHDVTDRSHP
jgi:transcriptional regulator with XRE-family HTH domain